MCGLLLFVSKQHFSPVRLFLILNGNVLIPQLWFIQQKVMASRSHSRGYYEFLHLECSDVMCSFETTSGCFFVLFTIILWLLLSLHQIHFFHYCWKVFCSWNFPLANFTFGCDVWEQETWLANKLCRIKEFLQQESFQGYVFSMSCLSSPSKTTLKPFVYSFDKLVNIFWIFCWFYQTTGRKEIGWRTEIERFAKIVCTSYLFLLQTLMLVVVIG